MILTTLIMHLQIKNTIGVPAISQVRQFYIFNSIFNKKPLNHREVDITQGTKICVKNIHPLFRAVSAEKQKSGCIGASSIHRIESGRGRSVVNNYKFSLYL